MRVFDGDKSKLHGMSFSDLDLEDDEAVCAFVEQRWGDRTQRRMSLERQWYLNVANYLGFQYHRWNVEGKDLVLPPAPEYRVRLVINRLRPMVGKMVSKFLKQRPVWNVVPATGDEEDILTAQIGSKILKYYFRYRSMNRKLASLFTWMGVTGNAFVRSYWDANDGPEISFNPMDLGGGLGTEEEIMGRGMEFLRERFPDMEDEALSKGVTVKDGDWNIEVRSPFEIDPDPNAQDLEDAAYLIDSRMRTERDIYERYGEKIKATDSNDESLTSFYMDRIASFAGPTTGSRLGDYSHERKSEMIVEHTLWVNPCRDYPEGLFITCAGDKVLARGVLNTPRIPYAHVKEIEVPGRFWGTCSLEQCMHLQHEYNRCRSQATEVRNLMSKPKWVVPKGSGIPDTSLTSEPGEVVEYRYPMKPEMITPPQLPDSYHKTLDQTLRDLEDVSAQREVSNARVPSGVRSGVAIAQLQEQDDSMISPAMAIAEEALAFIGSCGLREIAKNVSTERLIKIVGTNDEIETLTFKGDGLVGAKDTPGINYFDVEVQMGSQLPQSKAARMEFVLQLVQYGVLDPNMHRAMILEMLNLGTTEPTLTEAKLDSRAIYVENQQLDQGSMLPINPWDNDEEHLKRHRERQKRADYQKILQMMPEVAENYESHIAMHTARLQEKYAVMGAGGAEEAPPQQAEEMQSFGSQVGGGGEQY